MNQPDVAVRIQTQSCPSICRGFRQTKTVVSTQCVKKSCKHMKKKTFQHDDRRGNDDILHNIMCQGFSQFLLLMIADILLSEISLNMSIVTQLMGTTHYVWERDKERESERWGRERRERREVRVWRRHKQRAEGVILSVLSSDLQLSLLSFSSRCWSSLDQHVYPVLWLCFHCCLGGCFDCICTSSSSETCVGRLEFPSTLLRHSQICAHIWRTIVSEGAAWVSLTQRRRHGRGPCGWDAL